MRCAVGRHDKAVAKALPSKKGFNVLVGLYRKSTRALANQSSSPAKGGGTLRRRPYVRVMTTKSTNALSLCPSSAKAAPSCDTVGRQRDQLSDHEADVHTSITSRLDSGLILLSHLAESASAAARKRDTNENRNQRRSCDDTWRRRASGG